MLDPFELLKTLHSLSAVEESKAVTIDQLSRILNSPESELAEALKSLSEMSYLVVKGVKIYLTELGILKVNSMFC